MLLHVQCSLEPRGEPTAVSPLRTSQNSSAATLSPSLRLPVKSSHVLQVHSGMNPSTPKLHHAAGAASMDAPYRSDTNFQQSPASAPGSRHLPALKDCFETHGSLLPDLACEYGICTALGGRGYMEDVVAVDYMCAPCASSQCESHKY